MVKNLEPIIPEDKGAELFEYSIVLNGAGEIQSVTLGGKTLAKHPNSDPVPNMAGWKLYALPPSSPSGCYFYNGQWYCKYP